MLDIRITVRPHGLSASKLGMVGIFVVLFLATLLGMSVPAAQAHTLASTSVHNRSHSTVPGSMLRNNVQIQGQVGNNNANTITQNGAVTNDNASVVSMIYAVFGPYAPAAINVARCESGFNPSAYNPAPVLGSHAMGVFQILYPSTWMTTPQAGASPYDAQANIQAAHAIFVRDGYSWREWECQP